ncbi:FAD-dependent urate hydroxylase HpxO [Phormidium tenue]|uniref:FAD-dependent urate hydroxylase n=1 Tax=Phormidium tenue NIES-30 TaxID=549789 RepID=A0A1U7J8S6_9CYAN|nr:FAD-dependent urate hydroxylase HpxO [Phormidium tenue]MBD2231090.1 FAD-dependent urate hydroxylase HpxO [Phormidium tenue FACHB-1052]OKH49882.1 monooxygenase [Phormidium tenue NIES-30]
MYNLKVVIIGAGIGGLTTGIAMRQAGYQVEIYDRAQELRPAGAGISLWSNGVKVLNHLGLGEKLAAIGGEMNAMEYRSHTDESLSYVDLRPLFEQVGQRPYPVARTDLQTMLFEAFGPEDVHLGMNCVGVEQDEHSATAIFENGERISGDLVVGADGIHSAVRACVVGQVERRYARYVNWNGLVKADPELCDPNLWVLYVGDSKRASMMPVGGDRFYFFFGAPMVEGTHVEPTYRQEELAKIFQGWPEPVQKLIQALDPEQTNRLEIGDIDPLEHLVKGRIALLGDSAHATTPTLGQGGCQAIEDAEVLTRYLHTTNIGVADALKRYEAARKDRTAELVLKARKRTSLIYGYVPEATEQWYSDLKQEPPESVINALAKVILAGPMG